MAQCVCKRQYIDLVLFLLMTFGLFVIHGLPSNFFIVIIACNNRLGLTRMCEIRSLNCHLQFTSISAFMIGGLHYLGLVNSIVHGIMQVRIFRGILQDMDLVDELCLRLQDPATI